jgi:hypothetical protein
MRLHPAKQRERLLFGANRTALGQCGSDGGRAEDECVGNEVLHEQPVTPAIGEDTNEFAIEGTRPGPNEFGRRRWQRCDRDPDGAADDFEITGATGKVADRRLAVMLRQ